MTLTNYISNTDDLEIRFKEYDIPIVRRLSNGVEFEFDHNYNIVGFILPKFCQMIHRQYPPNTIFQYSHTIFDKNYATVVIQVNNQPIKVRIDLSELDK